MKIKIIETKTRSEINSRIELVNKNKSKLPSISDGWRFNFRKHAQKKKYQPFILTTEKAKNTIEGCLILNSENQYQIYMAYIEVAPHNKGSNKRYDRVAACLIAFACRQSFINGKEGYLAFDVKEEQKKDEVKLMTLYSQKYNAVRIENSTTMVILPEGSEKLINKYLK